MPIAKQILGRIFAVWAVLIFVPTMLIVFIPILLTTAMNERKGVAAFRHIARAWMRVFFFFTGIRIKLKGTRYFAKGESYVVVCNHNSFMDIPLTTPFIPGPNKTIAKKEIASVPIFGMIYRRGSVLVDRKSEESRKGSLSEMKQVLQNGIHMCIYPEGTRNKTSAPLQPFHNGAFKLSIDSGKAIIPTLIFNTAKVLPAGKRFFFWPVTIRMEFLEPIEPGNLSTDELKKLVHQRMGEYYVANK
jgi:1-acyl-sn-glycerol-3-phosphate acyltransferase